LLGTERKLMSHGLREVDDLVAKKYGHLISRLNVAGNGLRLETGHLFCSVTTQ
jgi:hypothetical protein